MLNIHMQRSSVLTPLRTMIKKNDIEYQREFETIFFFKHMNDLKTFQIKIVTFIVRGLNGSTKRRSIFRWLHNQKAHIYFLQETYSDEKTKPRGKQSGVERFSVVMEQNTAKVS